MKKKISYLILICLMLIPASNVFAAGFSSSETISACGIELPKKLPGFTSGLYNIVKLLVPIILIVMGMIDFTKAMMASDEKKMKDSQKSFITRLIAAVIIFLVMAVVQFIFKQIDTGSSYKSGFVNCISCILNGDDSACGGGTTDLRKSCKEYEGRNCPANDDYGNACVTYSDGSPYGGCRVKKECSQYEGRNCPTNDDYGNACMIYADGSSYGGCKIKE